MGIDWVNIWSKIFAKISRSLEEMVLPVSDFPALDSGRKGPETPEDAGSEGDKTILRKGGEFRAGGSVSRYSFESGEGRFRD